MRPVIAFATALFWHLIANAAMASPGEKGEPTETPVVSYDPATAASAPSHDHPAHLLFGGNIDLTAAGRDFGEQAERRVLAVREVEIAAEAHVAPWLYGVAFLTRPSGAAVDVEEAYGIAALPLSLRLKAGFYRVELGYLNTIHEPERPQITVPLPVVEFVGREQMRDAAVTIGRTFQLPGGHRAALSAAVWNGDNQVAFNGGKTSDKVVAAKLYAGYGSARFAYQVGVSVATGNNGDAGSRRTTLGAIDYRIMINPAYNPSYDFPARFAIYAEALFSHRSLAPTDGYGGSSTNSAVGGWMVADLQFIRDHHLGVGADLTQGRLDREARSTALSAHYSWYVTSHGRLQVEVRRQRTPQASGFEALLQWSVVLGPHSERPFLPVIASEETLLH